MLQADLAGHQDGAPTFVLGVYDGQQDGTAGTFVVANASQASVLDGDGLQFIQIGQRAESRSLVSAGWITIAGARHAPRPTPSACLARHSSTTVSLNEHPLQRRSAHRRGLSALGCPRVSRVLAHRLCPWCAGFTTTARSSGCGARPSRSWPCCGASRRSPRTAEASPWPRAPHSPLRPRLTWPTLRSRSAG